MSIDPSLGEALPHVAGLDLSLTSTGVAIIRHGTTTVRRITSKGTADATLADRATRLHSLANQIIDALCGNDDGELPELVVIEGPSMGTSSRGGAMHDRAGLWWLIVNDLHGYDTPTVEIPPSSRAKYATGSGNAAKDAVLAAVIRRYPDVNVTGNDEADALILAAMGARHLGAPIDDLPKVHLEAMDKVRWPDYRPAEDGAA